MVLGGLIVTYVSWRWIFWINVPTGVLAIVGALRVLRDQGERTRQRLDPLGMITLGLGLFGVLWAITKLANAPLDASTVGFLVGGVALIGAFVAIEARVGEPMLPLRIFKVPTMAASLCASLFQGLASYAVLFLVLMYLQGPRGLSPIHASLLLVPGYVVSARRRPLAGRLADRRGPVLPATLGLGLQVIALICYAQLTISTPLWVIVADQPGQRGRDQPVLPRQQLGGHEGGAAGHVRDRVGDAADIRQRRHGVLVRGGDPGRVEVDLPRASRSRSSSAPRRCTAPWPLRSRPACTPRSTSRSAFMVIAAVLSALRGESPGPKAAPVIGLREKGTKKRRPGKAPAQRGEVTTSRS